MLSELDKKRWRDIWRLRGQVMAIALVIASGIATMVMSVATVQSLQTTTDAYYNEYKFADVFADLTRAPNQLASQIAQIEGVNNVQTRIMKIATVDLPDFDEPVLAQLVSAPDSQEPLLNRLSIRKGDWFTHANADEVIVSEPFAEAHGLNVGDSVSVIMRGNKRKLTIVAIALCPEFIYALGPGALLPDDLRFGIFWVPEEIVSAAYDLREAFNNVTLSLSYNSNLEKVLFELDNLLVPYGGTNAIHRSDQLSNWFVMNEIKQQKTMASILPTIFILVAVFLANMVLGRLIATERTEIGLLKAFGYSDLQVAMHYVKFVMVIGLLGVLFGCVIGYVFGYYNTNLYTTMFRFPLFIFQVSSQTFFIALLVGCIAALLGAMGAVKQVINLTPAQAMLPPSPPSYQRGQLLQNAFLQKLDQPTRIAIRQIIRWPVRSLTTSVGVGFAVALVMMNMQWEDALDHMARVYFNDAQKQDIVLGMAQPREMSAINDIFHLPGVLMAEPMSFVSVEFIHGQNRHRGALTAIVPESVLQPVFDDTSGQTVPLPEEGIILSSSLASKLSVSAGQSITVKVLEGRRPELTLLVVKTIDTFIGMPAYINIHAINRALVQAPQFHMANLRIDETQQSSLFSALKNTPNTGAITIKQNALDSFQDTLVEHLLVMVTMFVILAVVLGVGVTYNSARIALSERARELATLRVLGFTRGEISYVLLAELLLLIFVGLLIGLGLGYLLIWSMIQAFDTELFRLPFVLEHSTYGIAVLLIFLATLVSAFLVRRRLDNLDLIRVLKTRE